MINDEEVIMKIFRKRGLRWILNVICNKFGDKWMKKKKRRMSCRICPNCSHLCYNGIDCSYCGYKNKVVKSDVGGQ